MTNHAKHHIALAFAALAFGEPHDALRMPDEPRRSSSICGATSLFSPRERLLAPDPGEGGGGGGGGGGSGESDKPILSQAQVDKIVQDIKGKHKDQVKAFETQLAEFGDLKKRLQDADAREQAVRDEAELKGKGEVERLQIQLKKSGEKYDTSNAEWQKRLGESDARIKALESEHRSYVQRHLVGDALNASGVAAKASKAAVGTFLSEAQFEFDDAGAFKSVAVAGNSFTNLGEATKHFLQENPFFASNQSGGSGGPRQSFGGAGGGGVEHVGTLQGLLSAGLQNAGKTA